MVDAHIAEKRLVRVLDKFCPQIPGYFLYYPSRVNLASKLKALVAFSSVETRRPSTRSRR